MRQHAVLLQFAFVLLATGAQSQSRIPVRDLGPIEAAAVGRLGAAVLVRALSNGKVLVNDAANSRLLLFNADLGTPRVVQTFSREGTAYSLIPYVGDSTLYVDPSSRTLLVLDGEGKIARVVALPRPQDAAYLASTLVYGTPGVDRKGRLVYRGVTPPKVVPAVSKYIFPVESDSVPLVRADFESRTIDTIAQMHGLHPNKSEVHEDARGTPIVTATVNPLPKIDQWAMLSDGTIAIVRAQDYHVDWIGADGVRRSSARMPFDWLRLTEAAKQKKVDSLEQILANGPYATPGDVVVQTPGGPVRAKRKFAVAPARELPDYDSALGFGAVQANVDGTLWILPRTSNEASDAGLVYDLVARDGTVTERVRLPKGRALAGFGPGRTVYLVKVEGTARYLERARLATASPR